MKAWKKIAQETKLIILVVYFQPFIVCIRTNDTHLLHTQTSLKAWGLSPKVALAQVNWRPALVFLMGSAATSSGGGLLSADIAMEID